MKETIVLATHNAGKIREFKGALEPLGYDVVSVHDVISDIKEPEETGTTFEENARLKALYYMKATGRPCMADDSGIIADALHGRPGVYSARYAGPECDDEKNNQKLIDGLRPFPPEQRTAHYVCDLVLIWPDSREIHAEGTCSVSSVISMPVQADLVMIPCFMYLPMAGRWQNCHWKRKTRSATAAVP